MAVHFKSLVVPVPDSQEATTPNNKACTATNPYPDPTSTKRNPKPYPDPTVNPTRNPKPHSDSKTLPSPKAIPRPKKAKAKDRAFTIDYEQEEETAHVMMRNDEVLTPYLGECLCVRSMLQEAGDLCSTCGGHIGALESNGICEDCELTTGELLNCFACNVSFHRGCMPNFAWGLTGVNLP